MQSVLGPWCGLQTDFVAGKRKPAEFGEVVDINRIAAALSNAAERKT
jgi:hypothetical protein